MIMAMKNLQSNLENDTHVATRCRDEDLEAGMHMRGNFKEMLTYDKPVSSFQSAIQQPEVLSNTTPGILELCLCRGCMCNTDLRSSYWSADRRRRGHTDSEETGDGERMENLKLLSHCDALPST
ncbi:Hypothetical predicted protein [Xyrichtys novacula]|uniref:Uncharacterized protein n=1 Tax=Xyrichtys novacula TaxID=13765 RepID=A0AAV1FQ42_XYRNO|nr:Hypothetical predicted protein [Xyrichtys novacula]